VASQAAQGVRSPLEPAPCVAELAGAAGSCARLVCCELPGRTRRGLAGRGAQRRRSSGTCLRSSGTAGGAGARRGASAVAWPGGARTPAATPSGWSRKARKAMDTGRAVGRGWFFAAEPERSAALADLQFQEQIFHGSSVSRNGSRTAALHRFQRWKGGSLWDLGEASQAAQGSSDGTLQAGFRRVVDGGANAGGPGEKQCNVIPDNLFVISFCIVIGMTGYNY